LGEKKKNSAGNCHFPPEKRGEFRSERVSMEGKKRRQLIKGKKREQKGVFSITQCQKRKLNEFVYFRVGRGNPQLMGWGEGHTWVAGGKL